MARDLHSFAGEDFCYLTTIGRVSGKPHTIEIWFAFTGRTLYLLSGGGHNADWVKNSLQTPEVKVRITDLQFTGQARLVQNDEEDTLARRLMVGKYQPRDSDDLSEWGRSALPVAVNLAV